MDFMPCLVRLPANGSEARVRLGNALLDDYLDLVAARARHNTLLASAFDLKVFFSIVCKSPEEVTTADILTTLPGVAVVRASNYGAGIPVCQDEMRHSL